MQKGFFKITNLTISSSSPPVKVKTVIKGQGDPGYLLTPSAHSLLMYYDRTDSTCKKNQS